MLRASARGLSLCSTSCSPTSTILPTLLVMAGCSCASRRLQAQRDVAAFSSAAPQRVGRKIASRVDTGPRPPPLAGPRAPLALRGARAARMMPQSSAQGADAGAEPRDKVGRPATWWQLPPVDNVPLKHHTDRYGSAVIEDAALNSSRTDPAMFAKTLSESMEAFRSAGIRAVWLRVATEACRLVPVAIDQGFLPHHAAPDHITFTAWLPKDKPSRLPPGPSHFIGVAGLVLDVHSSSSRGRVLVVQEKSGPAAGLNMWKLPGGLVDNKEDIAVAAEREVWEETGVRARFQRLMTIQENHHVRGPGREGSTDLFCVCLLTPTLSQDGHVPEPVAQEDEIAACQWMDVEQVLQQPLYTDGIFNVMLQSVCPPQKIVK